MRSNLRVVLPGLILLCLWVPRAQATYVINVYQSGPNVVASGSGSINTAGLTNFGNGSGQPGVYPTNGNLGVGLAAADTGFSTVSGPSFGSGPFVAANSASGTYVQLGLFASGIYLIQGYVSGTIMSGTATWNSTTIAALGMNLGTYTYTWGSGANADSLVLIIGSAPAPTGTPAPSSIYLIVAGLAVSAAWGAIRMRKSVA